MHAFIHTYIHTHIHPSIHACMHAYIHTWITYIHAYIYIYIYTHLLWHVQVSNFSSFTQVHMYIIIVVGIVFLLLIVIINIIIVSYNTYYHYLDISRSNTYYPISRSNTFSRSNIILYILSNTYNQLVDLLYLFAHTKNAMNSLCSRRSARHLPALSGQQQADGAAFALRRAGHGAEASWLVQGRKARAERRSSPGEKSDLYPRSYVYMDHMENHG